MLLNIKKLLLILTAVVCLGRETLAAASYTEILHQNGFEACIEAARRSAKAQTMETIIRSTIAQFASSALIAQRIGDGVGSITQGEFAELLDCSVLSPPVPHVFEAPLLPLQAGRLSDACAIPADDQLVKVIHGGGLRMVTDFVTSQRGYSIREQGTAPCEGMWVTPLPQNSSRLKRAEWYAQRHSPLFFDAPVVMVAEIDPKYFNNTFNSAYEKVIPFSHARHLREVAVYQVSTSLDCLPCEVDVRSISRMSGLNPILAAKLSTWSW